MIKKENLILTEKWDKTFPQSEKVEHRKVTFTNRYGITLAADTPAIKSFWLLRALRTPIFMTAVIKTPYLLTGLMPFLPRLLIQRRLNNEHC